jgi:hypothetical protein
MPLDDPATSDDGSLLGDQVLAKARFHRVLLESMEKKAKKERKEGKKRTDVEKKSDEKVRKEEKKTQKSKKEKSKDKNKSKKSKDGKLKKESRKEKKTKRKAKKKKSKTLTVEVSDDDSQSGDSFKYWWSIDIEKEKGSKKKKKSQIVSKLPKDKKRRSKLASIESSIEFDAPSEVTEPTERCSFSMSSSRQWSFSSEFVKKVSDDSVENSTKDTENTTEHSSIMWWDISEEITPSTPPTPQKKKSTQQLLSPCSDDSESDYDDVSMFSEESLSEEILDDLSCILDEDEDEAEDDSENDSEDEAATELKPSAELDAATKNSTSDLDSSKKNSSDLDSSLYDSSSICSADTNKKHLGGVKILSSRPSPHTPKSKPKVDVVEKYLQNITSPTSSRSVGSKTSRARNTTLTSPFTSPLGTSNRTRSPKNSPKASPLSTSNRARSPKNSPRARPLSTSNRMMSPRASPQVKRITMDGQVGVEALDGVAMVRRPGLFARRK